MAKGNWSVAEAKARFSEVLERAVKEGPQRITKHGREAAVVVSVKAWKQQKKKRRESLVEFFRKSPLRGANLSLERLDEEPREIDL
jgi:prevent-host-death family protein